MLQKAYRQLVTLGGGGPSVLPPHIVPIDWTTFTPTVFEGLNTSIQEEGSGLVASLSIKTPTVTENSATSCFGTSSSLPLIPDLLLDTGDTKPTPLETSLLPIPPTLTYEAAASAAADEDEDSATATSTMILNHSPPFDIVLLTDCVFSVLLVEPLINTILSCSDSKTEVICCHEIRDEASL